MIPNVLTVVHVVLSLIGIGSGVVAIYGLLKAKTPGGWTLCVPAVAVSAACSKPFASCSPLTGFAVAFGKLAGQGLREDGDFGSDSRDDALAFAIQSLAPIRYRLDQTN